MKLSLIIGGLFLLFIGSLIQIPFEGKEVFESESQYTEFKKEMARPEVDIKEMAVLSSSPPIIVEFSVYTEDFPYGEQSKEDYIASVGAIIIGGMIVLMGVIFYGIEIGRRASQDG